jgi:hypothetical protein
LIIWLKSKGLNYYDIGIQYSQPQWAYVPSKKEINISKYKRGFGGVSVPVYSGDLFFELGALETAIEIRSKALIKAYQNKFNVT